MAIQRETGRRKFKEKFQRGEIHSWELARILVEGEQEDVPGRSGSMSDTCRWKVPHTVEKQEGKRLTGGKKGLQKGKSRKQGPGRFMVNVITRMRLYNILLKIIQRYLFLTSWFGHVKLRTLIIWLFNQMFGLKPIPTGKWGFLISVVVHGHGFSESIHFSFEVKKQTNNLI